MVRRLAAVAAAALLGALSLVFVASPAQAANGWALFPKHSGWCVGPKNGSVALREPIVQGADPCGAYEWVPSQNGWYHIRNRANGRCLNVAGASLLNGAQITQFECVNTTTNDWIMIFIMRSGGVDWYQWRNRNSGKCMNVPKSSTAVGVALIQYTCYDTASNNLFSWEPWT